MTHTMALAFSYHFPHNTVRRWGPLFFESSLQCLREESKNQRVPSHDRYEWLLEHERQSDAIIQGPSHLPVNSLPDGHSLALPRTFLKAFPAQC